MRFCKKTNRYVDVGDTLAREKVGHALRDVLNGKRSPTSAKKTTASIEPPISLVVTEKAASVVPDMIAKSYREPEPVSSHQRNSPLLTLFAQAMQSENGVVNMTDLSRPLLHDDRADDCLVEV